jgi:hypothetical protein
LLQALQALIDEGDTNEGKALSVIYELRLQEVADRLGVSKEILRNGVERRWLAWLKAQKHPPTIPPKA